MQWHIFNKRKGENERNYITEKWDKAWCVTIDRTSRKIIRSINDIEWDRCMTHASGCHWPNDSWSDSFHPWQRTILRIKRNRSEKKETHREGSQKGAMTQLQSQSRKQWKRFNNKRVYGGKSLNSTATVETNPKIFRSINVREGYHGIYYASGCHWSNDSWSIRLVNNRGQWKGTEGDWKTSSLRRGAMTKLQLQRRGKWKTFNYTDSIGRIFHASSCHWSNKF